MSLSLLIYCAAVDCLAVFFAIFEYILHFFLQVFRNWNPCLCFYITAAGEPVFFNIVFVIRNGFYLDFRLILVQLPFSWLVWLVVRDVWVLLRLIILQIPRRLQLGCMPSVSVYSQTWRALNYYTFVPQIFRPTPCINVAANDDPVDILPDGLGLSHCLSIVITKIIYKIIQLIPNLTQLNKIY